MKIRVKIRSRVDPAVWRRQLPDAAPVWGDCEFVLDPDCRDYDWLVVYEDLPRPQDGLSSYRDEVLACDRSNTLLTTVEPCAIKTYGTAFVQQFGHVLTSQPAWALSHPNRVYSQPALRWFYGVGADGCVTFDQMRAALPKKCRQISTVCSNKRQRFTLHNRRYLFTQQAKSEITELDVFGRGIRDIRDKAEALDDYRYHIAIENHIGCHHWTEKLADAFLGHTLPFYFGCPNAADYFPEESYVPIDILNPDEAIETIRRAIQDKLFEKRIAAVAEARRRVMERYNFFAVVAQIVTERHHSVPATSGVVIRPRRVVTRNRPWTAAHHFFERTKNTLVQQAIIGRSGRRIAAILS